MHGRFDDTLHFTPAGSNLLIVSGPLVAEEPVSARATLFVDGDDVFHWEEQVDIA